MLSERRQFARALRKHATKAEDILWGRLRGSRLHGAKFRRQAPSTGMSLTSTATQRSS